MVGGVFIGGSVFKVEGEVGVIIRLVGGVLIGGCMFMEEEVVCVAIRLVGRFFREEGVGSAIWTKTASYKRLWMNIIDISNDMLHVYNIIL